MVLFALSFAPMAEAGGPKKKKKDDLFEHVPTGKSGNLGGTYGIAVGDVNGDGFVDIIAPQGHALWWNEGGKDWTYQEIPELKKVGGIQYGISLGDYNRDGLPDISTEPRGNTAWLIRNDDGKGNWTRLPSKQFPDMLFKGKTPVVQAAETNGWVDVDGDGWLDLFVPAYYGYSGLYQNLGPDKKGDFYFDEIAWDANIDLNRSGALRPEGAQFVDIDRDGDPDLWVCAELLRNESSPGNFWFESDWDYGVPYAFDEGAAFADYDMDGDFDLGIFFHNNTFDKKLYSRVTVMFENRGDSTYFQTPHVTLEDDEVPYPPYHLAISFADWDHDGDPDITFSDRYERNDFMETGERMFYRIDTSAGIRNSTPGWFDWDHDGDLDIANGIWGSVGYFFENLLYDDVKKEDRKYLRVRPVSDDKKFPDGLDTEFGATVEVTIEEDAREIRRRNFTASGHGYLNQSEYTLTFGLETTKKPIADVAVDFAQPQEDGIWRIDKYINPALADIDVLSLDDREIRVFRSGIVHIEGKEYLDLTKESPLRETPHEIWQPSSKDDLQTTKKGTWVGMEVTVPGDKKDLTAVIREVLVEGVLEAPEKCGGVEGNVLLWDTTKGKATLVDGHTGPIYPENRRVDVHTDFVLEPGHTYRVMAKVDGTRTFKPEKNTKWLQTGGGFLTVPKDPCEPEAAESKLDAMHNVTVRYRQLELELPKPKDTADTGKKKTDDTGKDDTGVSKDDTGVPADDSGGGDDGGGVDGDDEEKKGCGCATPSAPPAGALFALVFMGLVARRRE